ncbi:GABA-specific high-affinity permease [Ceratobasidium sp. 370]|nr:GABA-specific high-affinity permease [Ceratobasidium sp. 370]
MSAIDRHEKAVLADEDLLAFLGYKQEFKRAFKPFEVFGMAFSIVALMPSIASSLVYALPYGGPVSLVWGWVVASLFVCCVALAMAELASAAPTSGGLYYWAWTFSPPQYRKILAWVTGYANTIGLIGGIASVDWGFAIQIMAVSTIGSDGTFVPTTGQLYAVYVAVLLSHAVVCSLATRVLARLQTVYVLLNLGLFFGVLIALPAATPKEYINSASYVFGNFTNLSNYPNGFAFILAWLLPVWTINGFDTGVHISEEASNAATAVPWAIVGSATISGFLGTGMVIALAFCMGQDTESILGNEIGQPLATIFFNSFGQRGTLGLWSLFVVAQWAMGSCIVLSASRQVFAFARDGAMPFSSILYRMNRYTGTPVNTVWFCVSAAALLGLLAFAGVAAIGAIFYVSVIGLYIAYGIPNAARLVFRDHNFKPGPFTLGVFSVPIRTIAVSFITFMNIVFLFPANLAPEAATMNYVWSRTLVRGAKVHNRGHEPAEVR